jgi:2-phosphosulfolactate phosphatase
VDGTHRGNPFDQGCFTARFDWGEAGLQSVATDVDVLVLVDVLSFTTAVEVAVSRGASVYPYRVRDSTAVTFANQQGAVLAVDRRALSPEHPFSLSPRSLATLPAGMRLVLPSPNGSALSVLAAGQARVILAGCLRNAHAVALAAHQLGSSVAIVAAGEHRRDGTLRFAVEDLVGARAILSHFPTDARSPEAQVASAAFEQFAAALPRYLHRCASGRELAALGFADDVSIAAELDVSEVVPIFRNGAYTSLTRA